MTNSRFYRKNAAGFYVYPVYCFLSFWLGVAFVALIVSNFLLGYISFKLLQDFKTFSLYAFVALLLCEFIKILVGSIRNRGFIKYFQSLSLENAVRRSLLNTLTLNLYKDSPFIQVPAIKAVQRKDKVFVEVQKLPGMRDFEKVKSLISSSFLGSFESFAVVEATESVDGTHFSFVLEDVGSDKTFIPKTFAELVQKPYFLKLQEGLKINLSKLPHLAVWGQSGSGKTTVLMSIIAQLLSSGAEVLFLDGKTEFFSFSAFYPSEKIATDNEEVLSLLRHVSETIKKRQKIVADEVKNRGKLGLTGYDIGLKPIVIVGDEIGSIVAGMSSKEKKYFISLLTQVVQKGRSVSVFAVLASQSPAVDVLPQGVRSQFSTKILLGSAGVDVQRMAFDQVVTSGSVPRFQGFYMVSGLTTKPQKFYVPDFYIYKLATMENFEELYKKRRCK